MTRGSDLAAVQREGRRHRTPVRRDDDLRQRQQRLLLAAADVLEGKQCTAYPAVKPDVIRAGGKWGEVNETFSNAYVDGNLVTAAAWPGHPEWMRKFLKVLGSRIEP